MKERRPERGKILTIYLILMLLISLFDLFRGYEQLIPRVDYLRNTPKWLFSVSKVLELAGIVFYVAIWYMKKWGVIGALITIALSILLYGVVGFPLEFYFIQAIGIVLFCLVIWKPYKRMK